MRGSALLDDDLPRAWFLGALPLARILFLQRRWRNDLDLVSRLLTRARRRDDLDVLLRLLLGGRENLDENLDCLAVLLLMSWGGISYVCLPLFHFCLWYRPRFSPWPWDRRRW